MVVRQLPAYDPFLHTVAHARWDEISPDALARQGVRRVVLEAPQSLDGIDERELSFIALLRNAAAAGVRVTWHGHVALDLAPRLSHLQPPVSAPDGLQWLRPRRTLYAVRFGPGFALLYDRRSGAADQVHVLRGPAASALARLERPELIDEEIEGALTAHDLVREAVFVIGGEGVLLPIRTAYV